MSKRIQRYSLETVTEAINGSAGIVSHIAKKLDCAWITAYNYINRWETTKQAYKDENEKILDLCESKIIQSVNEGNTQDAKWMLASKAKHRGYGIDRHEITGKDGGSIEIEEMIINRDVNSDKKQ